MELASTPCGLFALAHEDSVLKDLLTSLFQSSHVPWEDPHFRHVVSLVTAVSQGVCVLAEESSRILSRPLCCLWNEYEDPVALITGSERKKIEATRHFLNIIYTFVPNFQGEFLNFLYFHTCICMMCTHLHHYTLSYLCLSILSHTFVHTVFLEYYVGHSVFDFIINSDIYCSVLCVVFEYIQFQKSLSFHVLRFFMNPTNKHLIRNKICRVFV